MCDSSISSFSGSHSDVDDVSIVSSAFPLPLFRAELDVEGSIVGRGRGYKNRLCSRLGRNELEPSASGVILAGVSISAVACAFPLPLFGAELEVEGSIVRRGRGSASGVILAGVSILAVIQKKRDKFGNAD